MKPKNNIVHLPVYQPGKPIEEVKRELGLKEVTKLASNENPFGSSPKAKEAILAELNNISLYPDGASQALTSAIAKELVMRTSWRHIRFRNINIMLKSKVRFVSRYLLLKAHMI
jgi:histidinol-phosphate aminotransferase